VREGNDSGTSGGEEEQKLLKDTSRCLINRLKCLKPHKPVKSQECQECQEMSLNPRNGRTVNCHRRRAWIRACFSRTDSGMRLNVDGRREKQQEYQRSAGCGMCRTRRVEQDFEQESAKVSLNL